MQDRFRFKYYHDKSKRIYDVFDIDFDMPSVSVHLSEEEALHIGKRDFKWENLMQCTGLKDKNGKLIYEGDIVRVNTGGRDTSDYGIVEYEQSSCAFVVTGFLENPSGYYPRKKGEFYRQLQEWLCVKIIGNVYEHPELLEVEND